MRIGDTLYGGFCIGDDYIGEAYQGDTHLNSFGWDKTISGNLPLTLANARAKALKSCKINPYLSQSGITVNGKLYKVSDGVTILDSATADSIGFCLDFGVKPKLNTKARIVFTPIDANNAGYFGARNDTDKVRFAAITFSSGSTFAFALTSNTWSNNKTDLTIGQRYDCTAYNGKQIINGTEYSEVVLSSLPSTNATFKITAPDGNGRTASAARLNAKYEIVYIWEGETPVLLAHPAIKNNVVGYYDLVSGQFIAPTTGTLTAGKTTKTVNVHQEIPAEQYQEVAYIGLQGDEYIDTEINPSNKKIGAIIDFQFTNTSSATGGVFGSNKNDGTNNCQFTVYQSKWRTKINALAHYGENYDTSRHTLRFNMSNGTKLDDDAITATQYTIASSNDRPLFLGRCNYGSGSSVDYSLIGRLYSSQIYVDGVLSLDFVPVKRLSDNAYGMYDLVSKTFFGNDGTGAFTGGSARQMEVPICTVERSGDKTENLFDAADMTIGEVINADGSTASSTMTNHSNYIAVEPNTTYTVKDRSLFSSGANQITRYHAYGSDKSWLSQITSKTVNTTNEDFTVTFTTPSNCYFVRFTTRQPLNNAVIMLVKGSTAPTEYIPYGYEYDIDLTHSGTTQTVKVYSDILQGSIDAVSGLETEEWASHTFDGTESFVSEGILDNCWAWNSRLDNDTAFTDRTAYCNEFKHSSTLPSSANREGYVLLGKVTPGTQGKPAGKYVGFGLPAFFDSEAKVKAWIAGKTVYWKKKTATTTQGTAHTINAGVGTNTIECDQSKTGEVGYISRMA